jgi:hypothetical protein
VTEVSKGIVSLEQRTGFVAGGVCVWIIPKNRLQHLKVFGKSAYFFFYARIYF